MHRGSINGIPGGNNAPTGSISIVNSRSPAKESYLNRSESVDDPDIAQGGQEETRDVSQSTSPPVRTEGIPIRR